MPSRFNNRVSLIVPLGLLLSHVETGVSTSLPVRLSLPIAESKYWRFIICYQEIDNLPKFEARIIIFRNSHQLVAVDLTAGIELSLWMVQEKDL